MTIQVLYEKKVYVEEEVLLARVNDQHQVTFMMDHDEAAPMETMLSLKLIEYDTCWDRAYYNDVLPIDPARLQVEDVLVLPRDMLRGGLLYDRGELHPYRKKRVSYQMHPKRYPLSFVRCSREIDRRVLEAEAVAALWELQQREAVAF